MRAGMNHRSAAWTTISSCPGAGLAPASRSSSSMSTVGSSPLTTALPLTGYMKCGPWIVVARSLIVRPGTSPSVSLRSGE
jgi:hypothetical protein